MTNCEACAYYSYDEDYECYICEMDLDEDEMLKFLSSTFDACPYYRSGDEYSVVRHHLLWMLQDFMYLIRKQRT